MAGDGGGERFDVELAGAGDQAELELSRAAALADDQVAQEAGVGAAVERVEPLGPAPVEHVAAGLVALLGREQAVLDVDDPLPGPGLVEPADELAGRAAAERVLELVAVAPLGDGGDDRVELEAVETADADERLADLVLLDLELARVAEHLPRGAGMVGRGGDAVGARLEDLERPGLGVGALSLVDAGPDAVAGEGAVDEDDVAAGRPGDPGAAEGEGVDLELELVADRDAGRRVGEIHRLSSIAGRRGGGLSEWTRRRARWAQATSSSSSAFWAWRRFSAWSQIRWRSP